MTRNTYYKNNFFINTKGRNDQVIHHEKDANSQIAVIIEAKQPKNTNEMLRFDNFNKKALYELIWYFLREEIWTILSKEEQSIKVKIKKTGTPLALVEWGINIYRGVLTGYNKAFIIDAAKKEELIAADPKNADIIKPILRGRDIKKYTANFADLWLIATFPAKNIDDYPVIKKYLTNFLPRIEQTGGSFIENGVEISTWKKTSNKWFETQAPIAYFQEFKKEKIIWKRISSKIRFSYSKEKECCLDSTVIATGKNIKYLTALLNSKLHINELLLNSPKTGTGDVIISVQALNPLLVYQPTEEEAERFIKKVEKIITQKAAGKDTSKLENALNNMVYQLYDLTAEEIAIIENS